MEQELHQRIRTGKMVAPLWFYLHPEDQVDLTNTLFPLDTYCTATHCLLGPTRFLFQGKHLILKQRKMHL